MAVSYANREILISQNWRFEYVDITLDSSYATSGEPINAADFGFTVIKGVIPFHCGGYVIEPVRSSDTAWLLKVYAYSSNSNTAVELVSAKNLSAITVPAIIIGR